MQYVITLLLAICLLGGGFLWRYSGPQFTFAVPDSVKVQGRSVGGRTVIFLNHFPFGWYSERSVEPTLLVKDVVTIDLLSRDVTDFGSNGAGDSFRVTVRLTENVTHTYFFSLDRSIKGSSRVTLRIMSNTHMPSAALHQQDWFWLREFYRAEVLSTD